MRHIGRNHHFGGGGTHLELKIDAQGLAHLQRDTGADQFFKTGLFNRDDVIPDRHPNGRILARRIRRHSSDETAFGIGDRHLAGGNHRA